jgi:hypothetical protein
MPMIQAHLNAEFWVEVKHRRPLPKRYTWEIHCKGVCLSVEESRGEFGSWEEASQVGNKALKQFFAGELVPTRSSAFYKAPAR